MKDGNAIKNESLNKKSQQITNSKQMERKLKRKCKKKNPDAFTLSKMRKVPGHGPGFRCVDRGSPSEESTEQKKKTKHKHFYSPTPPVQVGAVTVIKKQTFAN